MNFVLGLSYLNFMVFYLFRLDVTDVWIVLNLVQMLK